MHTTCYTHKQNALADHKVSPTCITVREHGVGLARQQPTGGASPAALRSPAWQPAVPPSHAPLQHWDPPAPSRAAVVPGLPLLPPAQPPTSC